MIQLVAIVFLLVPLTPWAARISAHAEQSAHDRGLTFALTRTRSQHPAVGTPDSLLARRQRSSARFRALKKRGRTDLRGRKSARQSVHEDAEYALSEPLSDYADGYMMPLRLGTPPQVLRVYMDTGSDLVWVPCQMTSAGPLFECMNCQDNPSYPETDMENMFFPWLSYSGLAESCNSPLCADLHSSYNSYDICTMAGCSLKTILGGLCSLSCPPFSYKYGDGMVSGTLLRDTVVVNIENNYDDDADVDDYSYYSEKIPVVNFRFGCADASLSEPIGIAGFGRGSVSFPSQMGAEGFSYCLVSYRFENNPKVSSPLVVGRSAIPEGGGTQYASMLHNPLYPNYYYLGLEGISVGTKRLELPYDLRGFDSEGNGGMIIDSGTTYTHLPETVYRAVFAALQAQIPYPRSAEYEKHTAFDLCYQVISNGSAQHRFPTMSYHFADNVTLVLPAENHFYAIPPPNSNSKGGSNYSSSPAIRITDPFQVHCLVLIGSTQDEGSGPAAVLGSFQQQNVQVVYDTKRMRIGFQPKDCAASAFPK